MNSSKNTTLLLIGDVLVNNAELMEQLKNYGFILLTADSEGAFNQILNSSPPDIILIGVPSSQLPSNILERIKGNNLNSNIPVILISSGKNDVIDLQHTNYGITDFISYPCSNNEIISRIFIQTKILELERRNKALTEKLKKLKQMVVTDELTGLYNRRYIIDRLPSEISHSIRYREPIAFIMMDIDHFKKINDDCGHLAGDEFLIEVSRQIRKSIREGDIPVRYGGEEFLIFCPNTDSKGGKTVADRIRKNIKGASISVNSKKVSTTVSLGISSTCLSSPVNMERYMSLMIHQADIALLRAKSNGRNRIELYNQDFNMEISSESLNTAGTFSLSGVIQDDFSQ